MGHQKLGIAITFRCGGGELAKENTVIVSKGAKMQKPPSGCGRGNRKPAHQIMSDMIEPYSPKVACWIGTNGIFKGILYCAAAQVELDAEFCDRKNA